MVGIIYDLYVFGKLRFENAYDYVDPDKELA